MKRLSDGTLREVTNSEMKRVRADHDLPSASDDSAMASFQTTNDGPVIETMQVLR